jgi:hypothetical protein
MKESLDVSFNGSNVKIHPKNLDIIRHGMMSLV